MEKPLQLTKEPHEGFYCVRDRNNNPLTVPLPYEDAKEIFESLNREFPRSELVNALEEHVGVFDALFVHCCSNGVFNAWGEPFDCTKMNEVHHKTNRLLKAEHLYELQWLCRFGASLPSPLTPLDINKKSWVYVRGSGVFNIQPSCHHLFLSGMLAMRHWDSLGWNSIRQAEAAVTVDTFKASDLFMCITPGVMLKSSLSHSPLIVSPGSLTQEEKEFLELYAKNGAVDVMPSESAEYADNLRRKFLKK